MTFNYEQLAASWDSWSHIPDHYNMGVELTQGQVQKGLAEKVALYWENAQGDAQQLTYGELDHLSNCLATSLQELGVQQGDRVFLRLPNLPEFYLSVLAIAKLGAVFIPSSTQFRAEEVKYRLQDSEAVAVITTSALVSAVDEVRSDCPQLKHLIVVPYPDREAQQESHLIFQELLQSNSENFVPAQTKSDDILFIAYTSGTTGDPKGVVHRHRYPISYESLIEYWHQYQPEDIVACPAEVGWLLPVVSTFLLALVKGLTVVLFDALGRKFDPQVWFQLFDRYKITSFTATPTMYRMLMAQSELAQDYDLSCWTHAVSAGEPLPADTIQSLQKKFGITPLDGIGMSECMVYCFNMLGLELKPGSCGKPAPGVEIQVLDDDLQPVPNGTPGVLCIRRETHPGIMKEYWRKPEQTAEVLRSAWYFSGDVVVRDDQGYFWFQGRHDDVMKCSGYRISPFEVESCLVSHPAVLEAAAVESPDQTRGMVVKAFLVLREGYQPSDDLVLEIQNYVKQTIAPYKFPRKIEFVTALPKTTSGKIKRKELRQQEQMESA